MIKATNQLPWPVNKGANCLLATHWPPDIDGLATAAAWYALAKDVSGSTIKLFCPDSLPDRFLWLIEGVPIEDGSQLNDFQSCLVFDCSANEQRTRLPNEWLVMLERQETLFSIDHHRDSWSRADERRHFVVNVPSTSCILMDYGLFHPLFFASVWSDTINLTLRTEEAVKYVSRMFDCGLTQEEVDRQRKLIEPRRSITLFHDLVKRVEIIAEWQQEEVGTVMVVCSHKTWQHIDTLNEVRHLLTYYADVICIIDQAAQRVSLWASPDLNLRLDQFAAEFLGGGGHENMAGGGLNNYKPEELAVTLKQYIESSTPKEYEDL